MATHRSAEKRYRQSLKRRARNRFAKATYRTAMKSALELATAGNKKEALDKAKLATKLLDKAAIHGVIHKKNAQRSISRLHARINTLTAKA